MSRPTLQTVDASGDGCYHVSHRECTRVTLERFERLATTAVRREGVASCSEAEAVALFWSSLDRPSRAVMSASDMDATLFLDPAEANACPAEWNLRALPDLLRRGSGPPGDASPPPPQRPMGDAAPALRVGQWRALSPLRVEDSNLHALSYLHSGCPRQWLAAPPRNAHLVELVAQPRPKAPR